MPIMDLQTVYADPRSITPHPRNPRVGNVGMIIESITENGLYRPIYVQRSTGYVLAGNHTLQALLQMGRESVPVIMLDVDDETALRILLVDNRSSELGSYNDDRLIEILESLDSFAGTGWTPDDLEALIGSPVEEIEDALSAESRMGDLQFRVIVDCNDEDDQARLIATLETEGRACRPLIS